MDIADIAGVGVGVGVGGVVGIGVDVVDLDRFRLALTRRPRLAERLFTDDERAYAARFKDQVPRLAARFAAREAVMKAMGVGLGAFAFHDAEVIRMERGAPGVSLRGKAAALAAERGITSWKLSLTHSDLVAVAFALALA